MLNLYVIDHCPYCNKVRSFIKEKSLDVNLIFAPRGTENREKMLKLGGKHQVPFLHDTTSNITMYESMDIIEYLAEHYVEKN